MPYQGNICWERIVEAVLQRIQVLGWPLKACLSLKRWLQLIKIG